jgi:hypothetical protein
VGRRGATLRAYQARGSCWPTGLMPEGPPKSRTIQSRREPPEKPGDLATNLNGLRSAASRYRQWGWIDQSYKTPKSRFRRAWVRVRCPERLGCLVMALTTALSWLMPMGLPETGAMLSRWPGGRPAWEGERA